MQNKSLPEVTPGCSSVSLLRLVVIIINLHIPVYSSNIDLTGCLGLYWATDKAMILKSQKKTAKIKDCWYQLNSFRTTSCTLFYTFVEMLEHKIQNHKRYCGLWKSLMKRSCIYLKCYSSLKIHRQSFQKEVVLCCSVF